MLEGKNMRTVVTNNELDLPDGNYRVIISGAWLREPWDESYNILQIALHENRRYLPDYFCPDHCFYVEMRIPKPGGHLTGDAERLLGPDLDAFYYHPKREKSLLGLWLNLTFRTVNKIHTYIEDDKTYESEESISLARIDKVSESENWWAFPKLGQ